MEASPSRPLQVKLALYMLYLSLGISVTMVLVSWLGSGFPGPVGYWLINALVMIAMFHLHTHYPTWVWYGGLLNVAIIPIAVWLYCMIWRGKNGARKTLLVLIILEALDSMLFLIASLSLPPAFGHSRPDLLAFVTNIYTLQTVLRIVAVSLLFARTSSDWFRAMKARNQKTRTKGKIGVAPAAMGLLGLLIAIAGSWQLAPWFRDRALIEAISRNQVSAVFANDRLEC